RAALRHAPARALPRPRRQPPRRRRPRRRGAPLPLADRGPPRRRPPDGDLMEGGGFLHDAIVYLGAAVIAVPITSRLGLGSAVGYIAAGVAIGPAGLGLIQDPANVLAFAELGVVLLLFLIGLELNPSRLWQMRRPIFGMGGAQVLATIVAFALAGTLAGHRLDLSLVAGAGFAMSSTALALQLLR